MGAYLRGYPEFFGDCPVRDVGLIASEGRMTIPIDDGTPAGILDIRHHYFEFIPEDQADRDEPETVEAADLIEGQRYFILPTTAGGLYRYQIHDLVRCVGFHGKAPRPRVPEQGGPLLEPDRREALRVPGRRRRGRSPAHARAPARVVPAPARLGRPARLISLLVEETDLDAADPGRRPPRRRGRGRAPAPQRRIREQARDPPTRPDPRTPHPRRLVGRISKDGGWRRAGEPSNNTNSRT